MKKLLLKLLFIAAIILLAEQSKAQIRLNIYPLNNAVGVSLGSFKTTNLELRTAIFYSSSDEGSFGLEPEIIATFRISGNDLYRLFVGAGLGYGYNNPGSGYVSALVPVGFSIKPFEKLPEFLIYTEISPAARFYEDYITLKLQPRLGFCIELR
ncbi:MAG: hypothetical protein IPH20_19740 [Bacteroidales bacterium]|nr:hypothetical protein [Bacteroidales bacterium]